MNFLWAPLSHLKQLFGYDESWIINTSLVQISEQYLMGMEQKVQMVVLKRGQPFDPATDFSFLILNHLRVVISRFVIIWYESARRDQTTKAKSLGKNHLEEIPKTSSSTGFYHGELEFSLKWRKDSQLFRHADSPCSLSFLLKIINISTNEELLRETCLNRNK